MNRNESRIDQVVRMRQAVRISIISAIALICSLQAVAVGATETGSMPTQLSHEVVTQLDRADAIEALKQQNDVQDTNAPRPLARADRADLISLSTSHRLAVVTDSPFVWRSASSPSRLR